MLIGRVVRPRPPLPPSVRNNPPAQAEPKDESSLELIMGIRASLALFARRPKDIVRLAYSNEAPDEIEELVLWARSEGVPCEEVEGTELDRRAESSHHEGLAMLTKPRAWLPPTALATLLSRGGIAIAFDRVRNPYNIGAILRSAAFLGIDAALLGAQAPHPALAPMAVRVAEGGADTIPLSRTTDLATTLARLKQDGVRVVGADGSSRTSAFGYRYPNATVLVVGNEREGLSGRIREQCDAFVSVPGGGAVESLNVSVAAGILMAEARRCVSGRFSTDAAAPSRSKARAPEALGSDRAKPGHGPPRKAR